MMICATPALAESISEITPKSASPVVIELLFDPMSLYIKKQNLRNIKDRLIHEINQESVKIGGFINSSETSMNPFIRIYFKESVEKKEIETIYTYITNTMLLSGVKGYKNVGIYDLPRLKIENDKLVNDSTKMIKLNCDNHTLKDIIYNEKVDPTRCFSENPQEVYEMFGIEAARKCIRRSLITEASNNDTLAAITLHQMELIAEFICHSGELRGISRKSLNHNSEIDILHKMSFEMSDTFIKEAAAVGSIDFVKGIYAPCAYGQRIKIGTGLVNTKYLLPVKCRNYDEIMDKVTKEFNC